MNRGLHFNDEWSFNDYHQRAAFDYLKSHPRETLEGDWRKLNILFFSVEKYGSTASYGARRTIEDAGIVVFRLMLWAAIVCAVYLLFQGRRSDIRSLRIVSDVFLAVVCGNCALPYLLEEAGFACAACERILIYMRRRCYCCRLLYCKPLPRRRDDWLGEGLN